MKRLLLTFLSVMAFAGMSVAQDIYSTGYYTTSYGFQQATVYKNGTKIYDHSHNNFAHAGSAVVCYDGNVFWVVNVFNSHGLCTRAYVLKNNTPFLDEGADNEYIMMDLAVDYDGFVAAVGNKTSGSVNRAASWMCSPSGNTSASATYLGNNSSHDSWAFGCVWHDDYIYSCGIQYTSSSAYHGVIWKGSEVFTNFDNNIKLYDIAYYSGSLYTIGCVVESGVTKLKVWQTSVTTASTSVLYTLSNSMNTDYVNNRFSIHIESGDIYVNGMDGSTEKVWKNGVILYSSSDAYYLNSVFANTNGVYYAGRNNVPNGKIWKDGSVLYTPSNCENISALFIEEPECQNDNVRSLPFTEGFENGETNLACWTKIDVDNSNETRVSYWMRYGQRETSPATGDYCVGHTYGPSGSSQEGWLISPRLFLQPGRDNTTLTFKTHEGAPADYEYEGVWVSTNSDPTATGSYQQVWTQDSPSATWKNVTVGLSEYQGQAIYIAFKYTGTFAHAWFIDDISVTEDWSSCGTYNAPYTMDFSAGNEPGYCWYIWDGDMSGDNKCWQYNETEQCAYHPWGPSGVDQYGCMISPNITLESGHDYVLKFRHKNSYSGTGMHNRIYYKLDGTGTPNPSNYTSLLWDDANFTSDWTEVEIPLSSYAGHNISFSFEYSGNNAHNWFIDDVRVEEAGSTQQYTITANANNNSWGTVTGGGTYNSGATCTLTATPNSGYEFLKWTKNGAEVSTNPSYSFTVTENASYTAVFGEPSVNYYTIATNVSPTGAGTVEGAGVYPQGTTTYLTATPNMGWTFSHWNDGITSNPRSITVNGDATYTAHFLQQNYTITVVADPPQGGTVSGGGSYHYGDVATLTATANSGYQFQAWSDGSTQNPHPVTVTGNADYKAIFSEVGTTYYNVSANVRPANAGSVDGTGAYPAGTTITLTATANPGYIFSHWNDGITSNPRTVTVNSNLSFTANFMASTYTITVNANPSNGGTVTGGGSYHYGETATLRATPNSGFTFVGWNDGSTELTHNVTVTGNATYTATFSQGVVTYYSVNLICNSSEGAVEGGGFYPAGSTITIQAIPNEGYFFEKWSDESTRNPRQITVNSDITLAAFFQGTGVDEGELNPMTLYPNPAKESIRILGIEANSTIEIYNSLGMLVKVVSAGPDQEIGIRDLSSGLYLVRCGNRTLRFVKQQ